MTEIPALPSEAVLLYLAEGAANVVYRISFPPGRPVPAVFDGKLLRLRKDLPTTIPCFEAHALWTEFIEPLFPPDQLVNQSLVRIDTITILILNTVLSSQLGRPPVRQGVELADDEYGLLVTDMTPKNGGKLFEFKPKWLLQSHSAPIGALRCRQCAVNAKINAARFKFGLPKLPPTFCPLDLMSQDYRPLAYASHWMKCPVELSRLRRWLYHNTLLLALRAEQRKKDTLGVLGHDATPNDDFLVAMTLRDCSVYIEFPQQEADDVFIKARLGDLDVKSANKWESWQQKERDLIDGGHYSGTDGVPLDCSLSPNQDRRLACVADVDPEQQEYRSSAQSAVYTKGKTPGRKK